PASKTRARLLELAEAGDPLLDTLSDLIACSIVQGQAADTDLHHAEVPDELSNVLRLDVRFKPSAGSFNTLRLSQVVNNLVDVEQAMAVSTTPRQGTPQDPLHSAAGATERPLGCPAPSALPGPGRWGHRSDARWPGARFAAL